ncbi:MAG: hypothetical protein BWK76_15025 [Desulfobulbaceae bacterium A2]|nr:MAG: hypothetical protein BWK76_15025 [Desulfobulbaceae bacterium A2]
MLFPTVEYAVFFLLILLLAWGNADRPLRHKCVLLFGSYFFYGFWDARFIPLLFGLSTFAWLMARGIHASRVPHQRRNFLVLGIGGCLLVLFAFKYVAFFGLALADILALCGIAVAPQLPSIVLPLGISFMVFHAISLLMDVYRGKLDRPGPLVDALLYVAFFPQLIAGPILRASSFLPQLRSVPDPKRIPVSRGLLWILLGLFKKVVLANALATELVDDVFAAPGQASSMHVLLAVYGYAVQIYCDFSGYSDIATGCALLLGYRFPANFANPYAATNPREFWQRWHISLSSWLRDYLYIPLGGSRQGPWRTSRNLMITMLLCGLWHGAAWTFVVWGGLHGLMLIVHRLWEAHPAVRQAPWRQGLVWRWSSRLLLFHAVCLGWILFRAGEFDLAWSVLGRIFSGAGPLLDVRLSLLLALGVGLGMQYLPRRGAVRLEQGLRHLPPLVQGALAAAALLVIEVLGPTGVAPFIYFQF